ncbi:MAG: hypothetical protein HC844_17670 [Tabrizicola sp.]|nr:hypothetical protein [Tabrizicola sp.]
MPNEPAPAAAKRTPPRHRQNAQGDHEGSPHRSEEFDTANPARQIAPDDRGEDSEWQNGPLSGEGHDNHRLPRLA